MVLSKRSKPKSLSKFSEPMSVRLDEKSMDPTDSKAKSTVQGEGHLDFKAIKNLPVTFWVLLLVAMLS